VCIKYLTRFQKLIDDENIEDEPAIRERLKKECRQAKGKDNRFVSVFLSVLLVIGILDSILSALIGHTEYDSNSNNPTIKFD